MAGKTFAQAVRNWERLSENLKPMLPELPHLVQDHADFAALVERAKDLDNLQRALRGKAQDTTKQRQAVFLKGIEMHERLVIQVKGKIGVRNENLVSLGLKPRRPRKPKDGKPGKKAVAPGAAPEALKEVTAAPPPLQK